MVQEELPYKLNTNHKPDTTMIQQARNIWARKAQREILNHGYAVDTAAAIDGARMTPSDREEMKRLCTRVAEILSKY